MTELPNYYTALFNAVTDALAELDKRNIFAAQTLLRTGQRKAEELYISEADRRPKLVVLPGEAGKET